MKLKDIFKTAIVATAGYFGGKYFGSKGAKAGTTLATSLLSSPTESDSSQYVPRNVNLRQFSMPTYAMTKARGSEMGMIHTDADKLNQEWEYRLNRYLVRRKYFEDVT